MTQPNQFDRAIARLEDRVARTMRQCDRFDAIAARISDWARWWGEEAMSRWLDSAETDRQRRAEALAALALKATIDAGHLLSLYEPRDADEALFCQVCRIEWERRYEAAVGQDAVDDPAAFRRAA